MFRNTPLTQRSHSLAPHDRVPMAEDSKKKHKDDLALIKKQGQLTARLETLGSQVQQPESLNLEQSLHQSLERQWRHDRGVQQDWLMTSSFAKKRRNDLLSISGGHRAAGQYGLSIASAQALKREINRNMKISNSADSDYQRDAPSQGFLQRCKDIYLAKGGKPDTPVLFVNSGYGAARILTQMSSRYLDKGSLESHLSKHLQELQPGLFALTFDSERALKEATSLSYTNGSTPSSYTAMSRLYPARGKIIDNPKVDNLKLISAIRGTPGDSVIERLRDMPPDHALAAMSNTAASLIESLLDVLAKKGVDVEEKHNPLLREGLEGLHNIADILPSLTHDSTKFTNGYQALMEELQICIAAADPYDLGDFRKAASKMLAADKLPPSIPRPKMHLMTSGMGSLSMAHDLAAIMTGNPNVEKAYTRRHGETPVYFEVNHIREANNIRSKDADTLFATLNHSLPGGTGQHQQGWNVDSVIAATDKRLDQMDRSDPPLVLILDATVEKRGDMEKLMSHFARDIEKGDLRMVICKSYQKYANLCSAKVMAGGIAIVSKEGKTLDKAQDHLRNIEKQIGWINNDEVPLLVHMLNNREQEFQLLDHAVANTNFVADTFFNGQNGHATLDSFERHVPFSLHREGKERNHRFDFHLGEKDDHVNYQRTGHLPKDTIRGRDSFAFANTTTVNIPMGNHEKGTRLSYGHESQAELTERFYMPSLLMHEQGSRWSPRQGAQLVQQLVDNALRGVKVPPTATLAQKLQAIYQREIPPMPDEVRLNGSAEQQRHWRERDGNFSKTLCEVASVLIHQSEQIRRSTDFKDCSGGPDRDVLDNLLEQVIQSGMPGISFAGRANILALQTHFCLADMQNPDSPEAARATQRLVSAAQRFPNMPMNASYLRDIPDKIFENATDREKAQMLRTFFTPLDSKSRLGMIDYLIDYKQLKKAEACIEYYEHNLSDAPLEAANYLPGYGKPGTGPRPMTDAQVERLRGDLMRQRLDLR
ncbi:hypothetical protein ACKC9G_09440 [Pokkaliibacter sp. CJK22405]|uniref:hypothetical protein n=1 Tax=Pokkaliibacter sp. CJK22405 TaxID=3384615 RepID=UPI0039846EA6